MCIAPLCDKEWLAWMPNNGPWEIFMWTHGTLTMLRAF